MQALDSLINGGLSAAISTTVVLTVADESDGTWNRADIALTAGVAGFFSGVCTSYFGDEMPRLRQKSLYPPP